MTPKLYCEFFGDTTLGAYWKTATRLRLAVRTENSTHCTTLPFTL